jgi:hypothetical protein
MDSSQILSRAYALVLTNSKRTGVGRIVGNTSFTRLGKSCPSCIPNLRYAKTSEVQFDFVPQKSGHEGAVSNEVTTA